jgi:pectate lyase
LNSDAFSLPFQSGFLGILKTEDEKGLRFFVEIQNVEIQNVKRQNVKRQNVKRQNVEILKYQKILIYIVDFI